MSEPESIAIVLDEARLGNGWAVKNLDGKLIRAFGSDVEMLAWLEDFVVKRRERQRKNASTDAP